MDTKATEENPVSDFLRQQQNIVRYVWSVDSSCFMIHSCATGLQEAATGHRLPTQENKESNIWKKKTPKLLKTINNANI